MSQGYLCVLPANLGVNPSPDGKHSGVDYAGAGHVVFSPVSGVVLYSTPTCGLVAIEENQSAAGPTHLFLHMEDRRVQTGDHVSIGTRIGTSGAVDGGGCIVVGGAHLHYEIRPGPHALAVDAKNSCTGCSTASLTYDPLTYSFAAAMPPAPPAPTPTPIDDRITAVRVFNCDDVCQAFINGQKVAETGFQGDSGWVDVTSSILPGHNTLKFVLRNSGGGVTYGFAYRTANSATATERTCGTPGQLGCYGNTVFPPGEVSQAEWDIDFESNGNSPQPGPLPVPPTPSPQPRDLSACYSGTWEEATGQMLKWTFTVSGQTLQIERADNFVGGVFTRSNQQWLGSLTWSEKVPETWSNIVLTPSTSDPCHSIATNQSWSYIKP